MHMSALGLPGYHLHTAYAGDWQLSPTEVRAPPHSRQLSKTHMDVGLENEEMCGLSDCGLSTSSEPELFPVQRCQSLSLASTRGHCETLLKSLRVFLF